MPHYMVQFTYSAESLRALAQKPEDRTAAAEALVKQMGGRLVGFYYHFGEYDGTLIAELPDDIAASAAAVAAVGSGGFRSTKTTRLFSAQEAAEAFAKASKSTYQSPKGR